MRTISIGIASTLALAALAIGEARVRQSPAPNAQWSATLAEILAQPDVPGGLSAKHFFDELERTQRDLARVRAFDPAALPRGDAIDRRLLEALLAGREVEQNRVRRWRFDPAVYMTSMQALVDIMSDAWVFEDPASHVAPVLAALRAIPGEVRSGQSNLTLNVPLLRDRAVVVATAASAAFESDLPALLEVLPEEHPELAAAIAVARDAVHDWSEFLATHLPKRAPGDYAIGMPAYDALLAGRHLVPYNSSTLYRFMRDAFKETLDELEAAANEIDPKQKWQDLVSADAEEPAGDQSKPAPTTLEKHAAAIAAARARMSALGLPRPPWKERLDVVPRPTPLNDTVYYSRSAGRITTDADGTLVGRWLVRPDDSEAARPEDAAKTQLFRPDDDAAILVTAQTALAEHLLAVFEFRSASAIRRAARSTMIAEGWALYNEQLARDVGAFPSGRAQLDQLKLKLWRIARAIVSVGLHTGKLTETDATKLLTDDVGLSKEAAAMEIAEAAHSPDGHLGYMGFVELRRLRDEVEKANGSRFSLPDFHKRLLEAGPLPPAILRLIG